MLVPGFTFQVNGDTHLWVVVSDPAAHPDEVVCMNFTTFVEGGDVSCVVDAGEHPWLRHRSCIAYFGARILKRSQLVNGLQRDMTIEQQVPVSKTLFAKIVAGANSTDALKSGVRKVLEIQGLVGQSDA